MTPFSIPVWINKTFVYYVTYAYFVTKPIFYLTPHSLTAIDVNVIHYDVQTELLQ